MRPQPPPWPTGTQRRPSCALLVLLFVAASVQAAGPGERMAALYREHAEALARSPFGAPLVLASSERRGRLQGDVFARIAWPFARLQAALGAAPDGCIVLELLPNVRACEAGLHALQLRIGRRFDQPLADADPLTLAFGSRQTADSLQVRLQADDGPLGTHDYRIVFEAVPLDRDRSLIRLRYGQRYGLAARLAALAYFASTGRDRIGSSVDAGSGTPVGGLRGGIERNAMRLYLAIDAVAAGGAATGTARRTAALQRWLQATGRFPRRLAERDPAAYAGIKRLQFTRTD